MGFDETSMYFCGACGEEWAGDIEGRFERALGEMQLPFERLSAAPLRLWHGPEQPGLFSKSVSPNRLALATGEFLWEGSEPPGQDSTQLLPLLDSAAREKPEMLAAANGSFAALAWIASARRLWLVADYLGARPLYFCESGGTLLFSTVLEILLRTGATPRNFDFGAFVEQAAFCYPLGDLTLYREIRVLRDSEYLCWTPSGSRRARYFDWSRIELRSLTLEEAAANCAGALQAAVRDRAPGRGQPARILLSGGLDSRCIAATLHSQGHPLEAATLSISGSLDSYYARRFASTVGIPLHETPWDPALTPSLIGQITLAVLTVAARPFPPGRVFTGDGGGETFGFLMMKPEIMALLADHRVDAAIQAYLADHGASPRLFRRPFRELAETRPQSAMKRALDALRHLPPQKAFHVFLLTNDLRRHMHDAFETAPHHGFDFCTPFYDRRILHSVLSLAPPLDLFLGHRLHYEILRHLPEQFFRVPWQTYPGHLPCPVSDGQPLPDRLVSQWELTRLLSRRSATFFRRRVTAALLSRRLPARVLRIPLLAARLLADGLRLANSGYLFRTSDQLAELLFPGSTVADPEDSLP